MIVKLLTEHHLAFLSVKGGCRGSSESTHVKMPHGWKSHALAQILTSSIAPLKWPYLGQYPNTSASSLISTRPGTK